MNKIKVAVLGASGQMGQEFTYLSNINGGFDFTFYDRQNLDITSADSLVEMIQSIHPDYIINCAAYTAVDKAETDVQACYDVNTKACQSLANAIKGTKTRLVHFSSDYVYHHFTGMPLKEDGPTFPQSVYAKSKYEGEEILRKSEIEAMIIRTSWVISSYGNNFIKTMMRLGSERPTLNVVNDQFGAPTYARHLAKAVLSIITKIEEDPSQIYKFNETYNYANEGIITWYNLATMIMAERKLECKVSPIPSSQYPTPATRPSWSVLSKHKIKDAFGLEIPHWYEAVKECMAAMD